MARASHIISAARTLWCWQIAKQHVVFKTQCGAARHDGHVLTHVGIRICLQGSGIERARFHFQRLMPIITYNAQREEGLAKRVAHADEAETRMKGIRECAGCCACVSLHS